VSVFRGNPKVGDRVVIAPLALSGASHVGEKGTVVALHGLRWRFEVKLDSGETIRAIRVFKIEDAQR
jgi:hypothetical protein